jgi:hypothetical protein
MAPALPPRAASTGLATRRKRPVRLPALPRLGKLARHSIGKRGVFMSSKKTGETSKLPAPARREVLRKLGRFTAIIAPAVTVLLAAQAKPSSAQVTSGCAAIAQPPKKTPIV